MIRTKLRLTFWAGMSAVLLTVGSQMVWAQAAAPAAVTGERQAPTLKIAAGDLVNVMVFDSPELSGKLRVSSDGQILLPLGGILSVQGKTAEQTAATIEALLREKEIMRDPHVTVFIEEYSTQGVSILGEVRNPGVYPILGAHNLLDFISQAGGVTATAGRRVSITHRNDPMHSQELMLDNQPNLAARVNVEILPGDTIQVARSGVVYVVGDLGKPGGFLVDSNDHLSVLQAVALAAGANRTAALKRTKLIRKTDEGRQEIALQLNKIIEGKDKDLQLQDGDILFVPSSEVKALSYQGITAAMQMTVGLVTYGRL